MMSELREAAVHVFNVASDSSKEAMSEVDVDVLAKACRFCATDPDSKNEVEDIKDYSAVITALLEQSVFGFDDDECHMNEPSSSSANSTSDTKRQRLALRVLINAANRSAKFRKGVKTSIVRFLRVLLRVEGLRVETLALITALAREIHKVCALLNEYPKLVGELGVLWEKCSPDQRSWISAFFAIHLEEDFGFLADCFADLPVEQFACIMHVTETILDHSETDEKLQMHPNNMQFCVDLLDRILFDLGEADIIDKSLKHRHQCLVEVTWHTLDIIANGALRAELYHDQILAKSSAVECAVDILFAVLDAQGRVEMETAKTSTPAPSYPDRPEKPKPQRQRIVEQSSTLSSFSDVLTGCEPTNRGILKYSAVRCIGNLCSVSLLNREAAGAKGGVIACLNSCAVKPEDKPFIMQWSITAIRHLCDGCANNQDVILGIDNKPTGILDRDRLLKELGVEVEVDEEGKTRLKRNP